MVDETPSADAIIPMATSLTWHVEHLLRMNAPTAALMVAVVRDDLLAGGVAADLLPSTVRTGDLPALRVMAAVHGLALGGQLPDLARFLPTLGGRPPSSDPEVTAFRVAVLEALASHPGTLRASLRRTPQTNEAGRAALLRCGLSRFPSALPVRLREVGASAGLNLRPDHLPGLPGLESGALPAIHDRIGCDRDPIDPASAEGGLTLRSYVWVDDVPRLQRLDAAIEVARRTPATVLRQDASAFVAGLTTAEGFSTVLWHSAIWVYLDADTRDRLLEAVDRLGSQAGPTRPFGYVSWEGDPQSDEPDSDFVLLIRTWSGSDRDGEERLVARGGSHGERAVLVTGG